MTDTIIAALIGTGGNITAACAAIVLARWLARPFLPKIRYFRNGKRVTEAEFNEPMETGETRKATILRGDR